MTQAARSRTEARGIESVGMRLDAARRERDAKRRPAVRRNTTRAHGLPLADLVQPDTVGIGEDENGDRCLLGVRDHGNGHAKERRATWSEREPDSVTALRLEDDVLIAGAGDADHAQLG